jgi:hypothetical protein
MISGARSDERDDAEKSQPSGRIVFNAVFLPGFYEKDITGLDLDILFAVVEHTAAFKDEDFVFGVVMIVDRNNTTRQQFKESQRKVFRTVIFADQPAQGTILAAFEPTGPSRYRGVVPFEHPLSDQDQSPA